MRMDASKVGDQTSSNTPVPTTLYQAIGHEQNRFQIANRLASNRQGD